MLNETFFYDFQTPCTNVETIVLHQRLDDDLNGTVNLHLAGLLVIIIICSANMRRLAELSSYFTVYYDGKAGRLWGKLSI